MTQSRVFPFDRLVRGCRSPGCGSPGWSKRTNCFRAVPARLSSVARYNSMECCSDGRHDARVGHARLDVPQLLTPGAYGVEFDGSFKC